MTVTFMASSIGTRQHFDVFGNLPLHWADDTATSGWLQPEQVAQLICSTFSRLGSSLAFMQDSVKQRPPRSEALEAFLRRI